MGLAKLSAGQKERFEIPVPEQRPLVIEKWQGQNSGPTILICAGLHGNEINGIALINKTMKALESVNFRGSLVFAPVLNTSGFRQNIRAFAPYHTDLNRAFPGSPLGSPVEQRAHVIFTELMQFVDAGIDLHDAGERNILLPHVRVHRGHDKTCSDGCTLEMGQAAGTSIIFERTGMPGMLAIEAAQRLKKPVLTLEVGGAGVLWPKFIEEGVVAIINVLKYFKVLGGKRTLPRYQFVLEERTRYRAPIDGIIDFSVAIGQAVHTGERLAQVFDPIGNETVDIYSDECGVVFDLKLFSRVLKGARVASILQFGLCPSHPTTKPNVAPEKILTNDPSGEVEIAPDDPLVNRLALDIRPLKL